ncbi:MAG: DNA polymerase [Methanogenium sp.]|jgi:uracil-DNA glycosylase family 4
MSVIRKGFFTPDELNEAGVGKNLTASPCAKCGLYKEVKSPKMKYTGEGRLKVLIIGEAPGKTEDIQNEQFVGDAGNLLRKRLKKKGLSLDKDFWKINAVNCRTTDSKGNNRTPTKSEIKNCKYYVDKAIDELKPKFIWLFGKSAIESLYTGRFSHLEASVWRKLCIPDRKIGAYVIPMYHPSYILRAEGEPVRNAIFDMDLDFAISCLNKEAIEKEDFFSYCHLLTKADDVISMLEIILEEKPEYLAFDYETTGLKPYSKGHKIPYISACDSEDYAFSFFYQHDSFRYKESEYNKITDLWCSILIDPAIQKAAHNLKFEKIWSRVILKVDPVGLTHCTMNNAHIIDSRKHFSGLKFQSFIHFGVEPYDKSVKPFLTNTDEHGFNKVMKADPQKMLLYSAMDSLMNYKLLKKQLPVFEKNPSLERARRFNLEGLETLANIEEVGIKADKKYYSKVFLEEHEKIKTTTERLEKYKEIIEYNKKNKKPINFESGDNIRKLFFVQMGLKAPKMTEKGNEEAVDKDVLSAIDSPISKDILILRKSLKTRNTYVAQFLREIEDDERIHPFCHLNTVSTYRSSSEKPNWQNIPAHDKEATKITRSGIMPSKGFKLLEWDYCLEKNTLVETIDGPRTIKHIVDNYHKKDIYVYCFNKEEDRIGISKVTNGKMTKRNQPLLKIILDNDAFVLATPDHPFMLRNGTYKKAKDLQTNDSLMPFYSSILKTKGGTNYRRIFLKGKSRSSMLAHNLIAKDIYNVNIKGSSLLMHHIDGNGCNNSLSNLQLMNRQEHMKIHAIQSWKTPKKKRTFSWQRSKEGRKQSSILRKRWWASLSLEERKELIQRMHKNRRSYKGKNNPNFGKKHSEESKEKNRQNHLGRPGMIGDKNPAKRQDVRDKISKANKGRPSWRKGIRGRFKAWNKGKKCPLTKEQLLYRQSEEYREKLRKPKTEEHKYKMRLAWAERKRREKKKNKINDNHKVIAVVPFKKRNVYNITVEKHHNFALSSGVIVKNCQLEVRIIACYTKDPVLINYINDPSTDMHRDQAMKLFALPEEEITKDIRFHAKNSFVFASFYGSYYKNTGSALWKNAINLKTKSGKTIKEHLYEKGIIKRSASKMPIDFFIDHVKTVEEKFWKKFKVTKQWQEKVIEKYAEKGYFEMFTGFREEGYLSRNDLINWRVQGVAFHCLLWSIIQIDKHLAENGFRTKIVGQIHDSCIFDNDPEEQKDVIDITEYYATKAIKEAFPFLIVPLQLEWEATEVDKPWYTKKGIQHG